MKLTIPDFALILLVGASGAGKSTFARRHFRPTEVVSSDWARGAVSDDENNAAATGPAFELVHFLAAKRLAARRLTVIDATNVRPEDRKSLIAVARAHHALPAAIILDLDIETCVTRNKSRPDRAFGGQVVERQVKSLHRGLRGLEREGFRFVHRLRTIAEIDAATLERVPLWTDRRRETGPFDIIGDVHGCADELEGLLGRLGYAVAWSGTGDGRRCTVTGPPARKAIFLGDLVDRGPRIADTLRLVMAMAEAGQALCILGNHEAKLLKWLAGRDVKVAHGLQQSIDQLNAEPEDFRERVRSFLDSLVSHYWLDGGALAVSHAGIKETMLGRASGAIRAFCLYGETTGETDEFGLPVRHDWAAAYRGATKIVYGHTPVPQAGWLNETICLDTGCVFGGRLTALRYPEGDLVSVAAARAYVEPVRPLAAPAPPSAADDGVLDIEDAVGKRIVATRLVPSVVIREGNSAAALEAMVRFAIDPRWLIYLPPTMSPPETSQRPGLLEHPDEAFAYYRKRGIERLICEEKHMGSRAVVVLCRDRDAAGRRFGIDDGSAGTIYTRTGRPFFAENGMAAAILGRLRGAVDAAEMWSALQTDWVAMDAEIMPWSAKASALIALQYAATSAAALASLGRVEAMMRETSVRGIDVAALHGRTIAHLDHARAFTRAWQRFCWRVESVDDLRIAPFHVLASEGAVHMDKDHLWHLGWADRLAAAGAPVVAATSRRVVDPADPAAVAEVGEWWAQSTAAGAEGIVVKPLEFIAQSAGRLVQPAVKCRGRDYLRLIYGPDYDSEENLGRLRSRNVNAKRELARFEFALGHEALHRFVGRESLRRVHECVLAILALESEPVDPRL